VRIFKNATFISCEDNNRIFSYLVEKDGKIIFTGDRLPDAYSQGQSVDLKGYCVVPAFADTHIHFGSFAFFNSGLDCRNVRDFSELGELIQKYIDANQKEKVILGFGCSAHTVKEKQLPQRGDLDKITSHPIMIIKYDGHAAVGNTALIQKLPAVVLRDSGFDKDTGWFYLNAFYQAVNTITKSVSLPRVFKNLIAGSDYLARKGIGLVHTVEGVGFPLDLDVDIARLASRGLPQKFRTFFQTMNVKKVLRRKMPCIGGCFATALDGCFGSEDAALKAPYSNNPNSTGTLFYSQKEVSDFVKSANRNGLQVAMHAIGDAAIEQALHAYEDALNDYPRNDHRHIIIHADLMGDEAISKAENLGVCIALQTPFLHWQQEPLEYLQNILGERFVKLIPLKSMLKNGLIIAGGSDAPCTLPDPLSAIHAACNHPNPDQSISVLDALRLHTIWSAKLSFDEHDRGSLTDGKVADFAVLNQNPLTVPVHRLKDVRIEEVYFKGDIYTGQETRSSVQFFVDSLMNKYPA
jgi:predicted amidohydrolase YtcJ